MVKHHRGSVRSVMDMSLFLLLLLSGLVCGAPGLWREYNYINQNMSWSDAQSYCRERFTDLATVDSMDDVNRMMNTVDDGYSGSLWIGLNRGTQHYWFWSMGNEILSQYNAWGKGDPNFDGECVMFWDNHWCDLPCTIPLYFVCYDETKGFSIILEKKNWTDAQSYCRQYHTDLITIRSSVELNQIFNGVASSEWFWIGLFFDSWQWSDQWNLFFRNWAVGQQFQTLGNGNDCVAMSTTDSGKWLRCGCDQQHPFICHGQDKLVKKQTVRFDLTHDGKTSLADSSLQNAILDKISEKLEYMGLRGYKNISWIKDESGEVFHLSEHTVNSNYTCDK